MPTTDRTPNDLAPDAMPDEPPHSAATAPTVAAPTRTTGVATVRAATPGATDCPHCGTGTINCHGRLDCPECTWTEARSAT